MHQKIDNINFVGLRFFTIFESGQTRYVYDEVVQGSYEKKFYLNNFGNHERDFTYIGDAVKTVEKIIKI